MDITIPHPEFKTQLLEMRISGYFSTPWILLNGVRVRRADGTYTVINDAGQEVAVRLNTSLFATLPQVLIEDDEIRIRTDTGSTQFAGWHQVFPVRWVYRTVQVLCNAARFRKLKTTAQS